MASPRKAAESPVTIRPMERRDLRRVLEIERETPTPLWTLQDFKAHLEAGSRLNLVALGKSVVIGFAIVRSVNEIETPSGPPDLSTRGLTRTLPRRALHLNLLHLAVASDWLRRGVGTALLHDLARRLRKPEDRVLAVVPESSLATQLLLRSASFRATRVLRGFFNTEDAYQMERRGCGSRFQS